MTDAAPPAAAAPRRATRPWFAVAVPAVAMSLGWGLRGQFGGPRGAMVPGALVAFALVLVSRRRFEPREVWRIAAAGALGFAIGGEETYMQTVGLTNFDATAAWGYLGLLVKGGVWGGLGGLFIGATLGGKRYSAAQLLLAFNLALAASFPAYWLINAPKLIYFSGGARPRAEGWAGLWALYLVLLALAAYRRDRIAVRMSLWGAVGCGVGFVLGVLAFRIGDARLGAATAGFMDWWKVAECGLGLIGGAVLGWAWWTTNQESVSPASGAAVDLRAGASLPAWILQALIVVDLLLALFVADSMDQFGGWIGKAPFAFIAPALMLLAWRSDALALALGAGAPIAVTLMNVQSYWSDEKHIVPTGLAVAGLVVVTASLAGLCGLRSQSRRTLFLLVAWSTVACAWLKMALPAPGNWGVVLTVQCVFTVMAAWLTAATVPDRKRAELAPAA